MRCSYSPSSLKAAREGKQQLIAFSKLCPQARCRMDSALVFMECNPSASFDTLGKYQDQIVRKK